MKQWMQHSRHMFDFQPDSPAVQRVIASPNHDARTAPRPDMIILHYTGMPAAAEALDRLCAAESKVSCHYFVGEGGEIAQLVPEHRRAWHAGLSSWEGVSDINARSIGIEIVNPGHDFGYPDFPRAQIEAVIGLCREIIARYRIRPQRVLAHSDVAPTRKKDPGEKFPWSRLAAEGVGLWVEPAPLAPGPLLTAGDCGEAVSALQINLTRYGYGLSVSGRYDAATQATVTAFQRHFRPARVDGRADSSLLLTLDRLLAARAATLA